MDQGLFWAKVLRLRLLVRVFIAYESLMMPVVTAYLMLLLRLLPARQAAILVVIGTPVISGNAAH